MKVLIVYNSMEYVWHRRFFIDALLAQGHEVVAAAPYDGWEDKVAQLGIGRRNVRVWPSGANPLQDLVTFYDLYRTMRAEKPDVVMLYTIKPVVYGSMAARMLGIRRVLSVMAGGRYDRVCHALYWASLRFNEKVFFQNPDDLQLFTEKGVVKDKITVRVPGSGVDTRLFAPEPQAAENGRFLLVSRMLWDKGIELYVAAARRLKERYPHAEFALLGPSGDSDRAIPQETLEQWDAEGSIRYLGTAVDIRPHMARCFVYVLPSYYREGIPRTNLEALAMGKPIITTDMPGCKETVIPDVNGFMIPPRDEDALVEAMEVFLKNPGLASEMGTASRQLAEERFRIENVHQVYLDIIDGQQSTGDSARVN